MIYIIAALIALWVVTVWVLGWRIHNLDYQFKMERYRRTLREEAIHFLTNPKLTPHEQRVKEHQERDWNL